MVLDSYDQESLSHYHHVPAFINFGIGLLTMAFGLGMSWFTSQEFFYWLISLMNPDDTGVFHTICILASIAIAFYIIERLQHNFFRVSGAYETMNRQHTDQATHGSNRLSTPKAALVTYYSSLMSKSTRLFFLVDMATNTGGYLHWGWAGIMSATVWYQAVIRLVVGAVVAVLLALASFIAGHASYVQCWHYWTYAVSNRRRAKRLEKEAEADLDAYIESRKTRVLP
jgi:uncharacterized membrane protein